jgi:biotin synthase
VAGKGCTVNATEATSITQPEPQAALKALGVGTVRNDWTTSEVELLWSLPFGDLLYAAQTVHRQHWTANRLQVSTLLSVKTGGCPEDCAYCPQSVHYETGLERGSLLELTEVLAAAARAKESGATRFCMGAAWRSPKPKELSAVCTMVAGVRALGLETCATLGMLAPAQARALKAAGLDYYNHNLDTSASYYERIITTRTYADRLNTLEAVRDAGLKVCCGGILGLGEAQADRVALLRTLATLPVHPESVPINHLVKVPGTPLETEAPLDPLEFVRAVAVARILMPRSYVRLSAGRSAMSDELQALCFAAGANSIFYGEKLLTTGNPDVEHDRALFARLGLTAESPGTSAPAAPT